MTDQTTIDKWKDKLTPEQFNVLFNKATEPPFTGDLLNNKEKGMYTCAACGQELFSSETKFDSGSGWPSFWEAVDPEKVVLETDDSHGMIRTEVKCSRCGGHLGHVFEDGPNPSGKRFCINSASLCFVEKNKEETSQNQA